jgi:hypothetical protein
MSIERVWADWHLNLTPEKVLAPNNLPAETVSIPEVPAENLSLPELPDETLNLPELPAENVEDHKARMSDPTQNTASTATR